MKKIIIIALIVSITIIVSLFSGCKNSQEQNGNASVKIGMLRLTSSAPIFIGIEKGFFKEEGIDLEVEWFDAAQPIALATASNQIDVGATGITAGLFNLASQGQSLVIVADKGHEKPGTVSTALMIQQDLYNQGIRHIKDLKGKKIGITQSGSTFEYMLGRLLELNNMTKADVDIIPLGKLSSILAALESKQIDGAIVNQPHIAGALKKGYAQIIQPIGDAMPYQTSAIFYSPQFKQDDKRALAFMKAYIKSVNYYRAAVLQEEKGEHYDEVITIIAKYTKSPKELVSQGLPYINENATLLSDDIQTQIDWYYKEGLLSTKLSKDSILDPKFLRQALTQP